VIFLLAPAYFRSLGVPFSPMWGIGTVFDWCVCDATKIRKREGPADSWKLGNHGRAIVALSPYSMYGVQQPAAID